MASQAFLAYLADVLPAIDRRLHAYLAGAPEGSAMHRYLYGILDEFVGRGGKRVRPAMAMLACEAVGGDPWRALPSGCAIEFFHAAALIHDDIMDDSELRRDERCAHIIHGAALAINAGDFALGLVCTIVVHDSGLDDSTKIAVLDAIGEMSAKTIEGQALDVGWVRDNVHELTPDDYLVMALGKTGFYSGISPLKIGALIGGASAKERMALEEFGKNSAIAFQIQDDLLNILGDEQATGKDFLNDLKESKRTLMVIHCLDHSKDAERLRFEELLLKGHEKSADDVQEMLGMLHRFGSVDYARSVARSLITEAGLHLSVLPASASRSVLASMADFFLERER